MRKILLCIVVLMTLVMDVKASSAPVGSPAQNGQYASESSNSYQWIEVGYVDLTRNGVTQRNIGLEEIVLYVLPYGNKCLYRVRYNGKYYAVSLRYDLYQGMVRLYEGWVCLPEEGYYKFDLPNI